jgi:hypothetical protein
MHVPAAEKSEGMTTGINGSSNSVGRVLFNRQD